MIMILAMIEYRSSGSCGDVTLMLKDTECLNHRPYSSWISMWKRSRTRRMTLLADIESFTHTGRQRKWFLRCRPQCAVTVNSNFLPINPKSCISAAAVKFKSSLLQHYSHNANSHTPRKLLLRPSNYHRTQSTSPSLPTLHLFHKAISSGTLASYPESPAVLSSLHPAIKIGLSNLRLENNCTYAYAYVYKQLEARTDPLW